MCVGDVDSDSGGGLVAKKCVSVSVVKGMSGAGSCGSPPESRDGAGGFTFWNPSGSAGEDGAG